METCGISENRLKGGFLRCARITFNMKPSAFTIALGIHVLVLLILASVWWINGRDDTWFYIMAAIIALSSLFYAKPRKSKE